MKPSDREVSGQLGTMSDAEFEKSLGAAKNVACFRYAMRRVETNLSDDALFQLVTNLRLLPERSALVSSLLNLPLHTIRSSPVPRCLPF